MEEKDKQIVHLQQQVKETDTKIVAELETQTKDLDTKLKQQTRNLDTKLQQQTKDLDTKLQQQTRDLDTKLQQQTKDLDTKLQQQTKDLYTKLQQQTRDLDTKVDTGFKQQAKETSEVNVNFQLTHQQTVKLDQELKKLQTDLTSLALTSGFTRHEFTLTEFRKHQAKRGAGDWFSDEFYNHPGGYRFKFNIDTNGHNEAHGTHLSAFLYLQDGDNDDKLKWPIKCTVYLQMLNQRADHGHHTGIRTKEYTKEGVHYKRICPTHKFFPLAKLGYCADQNTKYLKNDCLKFLLCLKVESV